MSSAQRNGTNGTDADPTIIQLQNRLDRLEVSMFTQREYDELVQAVENQNKRSLRSILLLSAATLSLAAGSILNGFTVSRLKDQIAGLEANASTAGSDAAMTNTNLHLLPADADLSAVLSGGTAAPESPTLLTPEQVEQITKGAVRLVIRNVSADDDEAGKVSEGLLVSPSNNDTALEGGNNDSQEAGSEPGPASNIPVQQRFVIF